MNVNTCRAVGWEGREKEILTGTGKNSFYMRGSKLFARSGR